MAQLNQAVRLLGQVVPLLGAGTEAGKDVLKALTTLSKHVSPGAVSPGIERTALQRLMMQQRQQAPQIAAMRAANAQQPSPQATPTPSPSTEE